MVKYVGIYINIIKKRVKIKPQWSIIGYKKIDVKVCIGDISRKEITLYINQWSNWRICRN